MYSDLGSYKLWYDGYVTINPDDLVSWLDVKNIAVSHMTDEILQCNNLTDDKILIKHELNSLNLAWNIPDKYKQINIDEYILDKFSTLDYDDNDIVIRYNRIMHELSIYKQRGLYDLLQALIYMIDVFKINRVVWGVGRGSSVASYVLYVMEVHDVDSVTYDLDFYEFLRI
jgi:DNA polymerase III alpha subunit